MTTDRSLVTSMVSTVQGHMKTLKQTGEGIEHASEIDMTQDNNFTNLWSTYLSNRGGGSF